MGLTLMYITNDPNIGLIAEKYGVARVWIDLETLGKEERQHNMNTVKSHHTIEDIKVMKKHLTKAELMVRVNPWNENSAQEIEEVIAAGAERIMLPMWKSAKEVFCFLDAVKGRVKTSLLLETKEAAECLDEVLNNPVMDEIYIGLNDLHLSYGLNFMFELLSNGTVEKLCGKIKQSGIPYGFGGIAKLGGGMLPGEHVVMEHYRLGSSMVILSRSFCRWEEDDTLESFDMRFAENMRELQEFEVALESKTEMEYQENQRETAEKIAQIVEKLLGGKNV